MEYVTVYAHLPEHYENGYLLSIPDGKTPMIVIEETLTAEERRKRLEEIIRRYRLK